MTDPEFADATYVEPITPGVRGEGHRPGAAGRAAGHAGRADRAQHRGRAARGRRAGQVRRRADRRQHRRHPPRRGPAAVQGDRGPGRRRLGLADRRAWCRGRGSATRWTRSATTVAELGPAGGDPARRSPWAASARAWRTPPRTWSGWPAAGWPRRPVHEVLIEESVLGWKEYELELMRDRHDNVVVVCSIENIDPMGVHTGDSVTVAPAMTLTDREYQRMRDLGIAVLREVGVDTGGCNIQFAVHPDDRPAGRHRDEPAGVALVGAGLEGDRLPDREDRREAGHRLHPRRDPQRHHAARRRPRSSRRWTTWW